MGTYFHDELHGPDKQHEELEQIRLSFFLQAVPTILATRCNNFNVGQALVEVSQQQIRVGGTFSARADRGFFCVRFLIVLLFELSDQLIQREVSILRGNILRGGILRGKVPGGNIEGSNSGGVFLVLFLTATDIIGRMTMK